MDRLGEVLSGEGLRRADAGRPVAAETEGSAAFCAKAAYRCDYRAFVPSSCRARRPRNRAMLNARHPPPTALAAD